MNAPASPSSSSVPWVTVGAYANGWEADLALGLLQAEGLPAHLENREFVGMDWTIAAAVGWIKVLSPPDSAQAARAVLSKMEQSGRAGDVHVTETELTDADQCLRCGGAMPVGDADCDACGWSYVAANGEGYSETSDIHEQRRNLHRAVLIAFYAVLLLALLCVASVSVSWFF